MVYGLTLGGEVKIAYVILKRKEGNSSGCAGPPDGARERSQRGVISLSEWRMRNEGCWFSRGFGVSIFRAELKVVS